MFGGFAQQGKHRPHELAEILLVRNAPAPVACACGVAIVVVHVNQVDIAGDIELARAQFTHAHNAQTCAQALRSQRFAMNRV